MSGTGTEPAVGGPRRVLHALAVSVPHLNGYTVRSRWIVDTQRERLNLEPRVATSPFYAGNPAAVEEATLAGTPYHRVPHPVDSSCRLDWGDRWVAFLFRLRRSRIPGRWLRPGKQVLRRLERMEEAVERPGSDTGSTGLERLIKKVLTRTLLPAMRSPLLRWAESALYHGVERLEESLLMRRFARSLERLAVAEGAELIHAHSPFRTGLPALRASRRLGLPFVYEVRGIWEESAVVSGYFRRDDRSFHHWRQSETRVMKQADAVICICEELRHEVVRRGVDPDRVFVVPNAVAPEALHEGAGTASPRAEEIRTRLASVTVGYVGSLRDMEGVDELVRGAAEVVHQGHDLSLLVVGDGPAREKLEALAVELGLEGRAFFPGQVPHDEVGRFYESIDLFAITRPDTPVTRLVTPLKPLEAMALGRALVVSDLPALREIVGGGENALVYQPGDIADLARQLVRLIEDRELRRRLATAGRRWTLEHRTWARVVARTPEIYRSAVRSRDARK